MCYAVVIIHYLRALVNTFGNISVTNLSFCFLLLLCFFTFVKIFGELDAGMRFLECGFWDAVWDAVFGTRFCQNFLERKFRHLKELYEWVR